MCARLLILKNTRVSPLRGVGTQPDATPQLAGQGTFALIDNPGTSAAIKA